ncbi:MAG: hypothetical protein B7Z81_09605, partial [Acidocella sp. 20-61-6]
SAIGTPAAQKLLYVGLWAFDVQRHRPSVAKVFLLLFLQKKKRLPYLNRATNRTQEHTCESY